MLFPSSSKTPGSCSRWRGRSDGAVPPRSCWGHFITRLDMVGNAHFGWRRPRRCGWKPSWHRHVEICSATDFSLGRDAGRRQKIYFSASAVSAGGGLLHMKPLTPLVVLCSCGSTGFEMLLLLLRQLLLTLSGPLDFILNIYWTFGLMPVTLQVSYMMGIKAKTEFFCKRLAHKKAIPDCSLLGTHISGCISGIPLAVTFLWCFSLV